MKSRMAVESASSLPARYATPAPSASCSRAPPRSGTMTGTPLARASLTARPNVSASQPWTRASALARTRASWDRSFTWPTIRVFCRRRQARYSGDCCLPEPTIRRPTGFAADAVATARTTIFQRFSGERRPMPTRSVPDAGRPRLPSRLLRSRSSRRAGLKRSGSTPKPIVVALPRPAAVKRSR